MMTRVLVVDDEPAIREVLAMWLQDDGWNVTTAANGAEALSEMRSRSHDVVLLDLAMPVLDGWSVLAQRRLDRELTSIPVVVMSAGGPEALDHATALGADGCITKPLDMEVITDVLNHSRKVISRARSAGAICACRSRR